MSNFVVFKKHEPSTGEKVPQKEKSYLLDLDKVDYVVWDPLFFTLEKERVPLVEIRVGGTEIVLYRDDAIFFYDNFCDEKLFKR